jgi:hypothetical protein
LALINLTGDRYGDWLVVRLHDVNSFGQSVWLVVCTACGLQKTIQSQHLRSGASVRCPMCRKRGTA